MQPSPHISPPRLFYSRWYFFSLIHIWFCLIRPAAPRRMEVSLCKERKAAQRAAIEELHMNHRYINLHRPPLLLQGPYPSLVVAQKVRNIADWKLDRASLGKGRWIYGLWMGFSRGRAGCEAAYLLAFCSGGGRRASVDESDAQSQPELCRSQLWSAWDFLVINGYAESERGRRTERRWELS